jgi:hypothetical protein
VKRIIIGAIVLLVMIGCSYGAYSAYKPKYNQAIVRIGSEYQVFPIESSKTYGNGMVRIKTVEGNHILTDSANIVLIEEKIKSSEN